VLRRCVWSRNIKNGCSIYIYIYDISRLRVKNLPKISFSKHLITSCSCKKCVWRSNSAEEMYKFSYFSTNPPFISHTYNGCQFAVILFTSQYSVYSSRFQIIWLLKATDGFRKTLHYTITTRFNDAT